jgi:hypothetical protein
MEIDYNSAKITVDINGSAPGSDISPDGQWAALHLTRNAERYIAGDKTATDAELSAINITGSVDVHHRSAEDILRTTQFRFVQLAFESVSYALYAGRTSRDGFLSLDFTDPPAFPQKFAFDFVLDSGPEFFGTAVMPFTNLRTPVIFPKRDRKGTLVPGISTVVTDMDDHPAFRMRLAFQNKETGTLNYLAQAIREAYFVTAFVTRDSQGKIKIMAHVTWKALWNAQFHWVGGNCIPHPVVGAFAASESVNGPPTGSIFGRTSGSVADKIINPTTDPAETANALMRTAQRNMDAHPLFWNRTFGTQWPAHVTSTFWTP